MNLYYETSDTLVHHGVKGMKWGVRRYQNADGTLTNAGKKRQTMLEARDAKNYAYADKKVKQAAYTQAFNRGTSIRNQYGSKGRATNKLIADTAEASNKADKTYKQAKKDYRSAKKDFKEQKKRDKYEKYGLDYDNLDHVVNVYNHGYKGAQRIQKRMDKTGMSDLKSSMIEAGRQTATVAMATVGTIAVAGLIASKTNSKYELLDSAGKVIRRYN